MEMKKTQLLMDKSVNLGLSIQELSQVLIYEFWYDYVKPESGEKAKLHHMNTNSFLVYKITYM